ncbi:hypothetical protein DH09_03425 [Bacillaceae bacterium JMAK1]|nr:hypothetical protein DH09_03425 [Bacillaceae bacterium JMAK1]
MTAHEEFEIEAKQLLTTGEFTKLCNHFQLKKEDFQSQHNHYFDTGSFQIKERNAVLRIREKSSSCVLTLKIKEQDGSYERHETLRSRELPQSSHSELLTWIIDHWSIESNELIHLGSLETNRASFEYENGTLFFDHSRYLGVDDYELEFEGRSKQHVDTVMNAIKSSFNLSITEEPDPKVKRFFKRKEKL